MSLKQNARVMDAVLADLLPSREKTFAEKVYTYKAANAAATAYSDSIYKRDGTPNNDEMTLQDDLDNAKDAAEQSLRKHLVDVGLSELDACNMVWGLA